MDWMLDLLEIHMIDCIFFYQLILVLFYIYFLSGDIGKLLEGLVQHGYRSQAGQLQKLLGDTLKMMEKSIPEIWQPELENFPTLGQVRILRFHDCNPGRSPPPPGTQVWFW